MPSCLGYVMPPKSTLALLYKVEIEIIDGLVFFISMKAPHFHLIVLLIIILLLYNNFLVAEAPLGISFRGVKQFFDRRKD